MSIVVLIIFLILIILYIAEICKNDLLRNKIWYLEKEKEMLEFSNNIWYNQYSDINEEYLNLYLEYLQRK